MLEERDQRGGHRHQLLGADVHVVDALPLDGHEVAADARADALVDQVALLVGGGVGLGDDVLLLLPGGQVPGVRLGLDQPLLLPLERSVGGLELVAGDDLAELEGTATDPVDSQMIDDAAVLDALVRALDEAVLVDAGEGGERRDQSDVRTFGGLDRTDPAVVRGVHVAHLESGALARQAARAEGAQAPLVGHLGERVGLVHELRQLRGAEELLDRRDHRLRVDQVVRHRRVDVLVNRHLLLDRALHAHQADPELVLEQLADRAHAAVAEVVDVVDPAHFVVEPQEVFDHPVEVVVRQRLLLDRHLGVELDVELEPADAREVVALGVEEHAVEKGARALQRWRVTGAHAPVDLDQRLLGVGGRVLLEGVGQDVAAQLPIGEEDLEIVDLATLDGRLDVFGHDVVGLEQHLAGVEVDHVGDEVGAIEVGHAHGLGDGPALVELLGLAVGKLDAGEQAVGLAQSAAVALAQALALEHLGRQVELGLAAPLEAHRNRHAELAQDRLVGLEAERA